MSRPTAIIIRHPSRPLQSDLSSALASAGFAAYELRAIDTSEVREAPIKGLFKLGPMTARLGYVPSAAELACAASHACAYRWLNARTSSGAFVFEDDVVPADSFSTLEPRALEQLNGDPVIVTLWSRGFRLARVSPSAAGLYPLSFTPGQTASYFISSRAVDIAASAVIDGPADWPSWSARVRFFAQVPWPVRELPLASLITPRDGAPHSSLTKQSWMILRPGSDWRSRARWIGPVVGRRVSGRVWRLRGQPTHGPGGELWSAMSLTGGRKTRESAMHSFPKSPAGPGKPDLIPLGWLDARISLIA